MGQKTSRSKGGGGGVAAYSMSSGPGVSRANTQNAADISTPAHKSKAKLEVRPEGTNLKPEFIYETTTLHTLSSTSITISFPINKPHQVDTQLEWYRGKDRLDPSRARYETNVRETEVQLSIKDTRTLDGGEYRVRAYNAYGSAEATCMLKVRDISKAWRMVENHRVQMCERIDARKMIPYLKQSKIIHPSQILRIQSLASPIEQVDALIDFLVLQKPEVCEQFFYLLRQLGQQDIVDLVLADDTADGMAGIQLRYNAATPILAPAAADRAGIPPEVNVGAISPTISSLLDDGSRAFLTPLSDVLAVSTDTVTMSCQIPLGLQSVQFTWSKNAVPLSDDRCVPENGPGYAKLTIQEAKVDDTGRYTVTVSTASGSGKCSCDLIVQDIHNSQTYIRECRAIISNKMNINEMLPLLKDIVTDEQETQLRSMEAKLTRGEELINLLLKRPAEDYKTFFHALRETDCGHLVDIILSEGCKPRFVTELHNKKATSGDDVTLTCQLHIESHSPSILWSKDGSALHGGRYYMKCMASLTELTIKQVNMMDTGGYEVKASNKFGTATTTCYLEVQGSCPKFLTELKDLKSLTGSPIDMACQISLETPQVSFTWYKDGQEILVSDPRYTISGAQGTSTVSLLKGCAEDAGRYEVVASNKFGKATSSCILSVKDEIDMTKAAPGWNATKYLVIDEVKYNEYKDKGLCDEAIMEKDKRKKDRIDALLKHYSLPENRPRPDDVKPKSLNIVLIGRTGVGKSTTANTFLGVETFQGSSKAKSETQTVAYDEVELDNRVIRVIDTPGLADTDVPPEVTALELAKVIDLCPEGVHAFLYLQDANTQRFTKEQRDVKDQIMEIFGRELLLHTAMVLTHAEGAFKKRSLRDYLDEDLQGSPLERFIKFELQNHIVAIDNQVDTNYERECMRRALLNITDKVVEFVDNEIYTHEIFQHAKELKKSTDEARSANLGLMQRTEKAAFQEKLRSMRETLHTTVLEYFETRSATEIQHESREGFPIVKEEIRVRIKPAFSSDETSMRLGQLSVGSTTLFDDIVEETIHAGLNSHMFKQAKKEQNQRAAKKYEIILQMGACATKAKKKMNKAERKEVRKHGEKSGSKSELDPVDNYMTIKNAITQKISKQHSNLLEEDRHSLTDQEREAEIESLTRFASKERAYEDLIVSYLAKADNIIWTEIQKYVRKLTFNEWNSIDKKDYDVIYVEVKKKLSPEIHDYLTEVRIRNDIRKQTDNKKESLDKLVTRITNMIRSILKDLFTQCAIM